MNLPVGSAFRLVPRGGPGLSCDGAGVWLGGVQLVGMPRGSDRLEPEVRSLEGLGEILRLAYGEQPGEVVRRCP